MNTTTVFLTLLVTATLIFSSAVIAIDEQDESKGMNKFEENDIISATLSDPNGEQTGTQGPSTTAVQNNQQPTSRDLWDLAFTFDAGGDSGSLYLVGLGFDGEYFYCPEFLSNTVYKFDIDGNYLSSFTISGVPNILDLTYDEETNLFYGAPQSPNVIYVLDFENEELVDTISVPYASWNLAYTPDADDGNGGFWTGQWGNHMTLIDMSGGVLDTMAPPDSMFGFAYDNTFEWEEYNGPFMWVSTGTSTGMDCIIKCIDIDTGALIPDLEMNVAVDIAPGMAGGLELTYLWDSSVSVLTGLSQGVTNDYAYGYEIKVQIPLEHDVGVKSITNPVEGPATEFVTPEVLVKNYGNNSETVDVQFEIIKCEAGPPLYYENFSGTFPPDGWTTDIWDKVETNNAGGEPPEAEAYKYDYIPGQYYYNYIMSPPVNCTGFEKVNVMFHFAIDIQSANYVYLNLKCRANSTDPWRTLTPWDNPIPEDIEATWYEIGCYGWGEDIGSAFQVMLEMTSYYSYYNYVWLDDFTIEGCAGCAEYAALVTEVEVPYDGEVTVEFPDWTPSEWHNPDYQDTWEEYPITAYTILDIDEKAKNDKKQKLVSMYYPWNHDVGSIGLEGPESGPAQTFPIEGTIKNMGQYDECCFKIYATVAELGAPEVLLTEDFYPYYTFPPAGWTRTDTKWRGYSGNMCGGGGQEAQFYYYPSATNDFRLYSPPIDTRGYSKMSIQFLQYVNHYTTPYTLKVETSEDAISWTTVWEIEPTGSIPAELVEIETTANADKETTYVSWTFSGYSWNINYWHIDNVEIGGVVSVEAEYTDSYCVDDIPDGEEMVLEFDDWTPDFLSEGETGTKNYIVKLETDLLDPIDNNQANDAFTMEIELDFFHDVGIKEVTSPVSYARAVDWIQYSDETIENALGLTSAPNVITEAIKLTPDELGAYSNHKITQIRVCKGYPGYNNIHDYEVWMYTGDQPTDPDEGTIVATGTSPQPMGWFEIATEDYAFGPTDTVWVGVNWDHYATGTFPISMDNSIVVPGKGSWWNYNLGSGWAGFAEYAGYTMMLGVGVEEAVSVYITPGTQDIIAIAENIGTFPETDMTCYAEILEYYTNCSMGTLVYADNITGIDLEEPLGGTETLTFDDYTFAVEGVYFLELNLVNDDDDEPGNNLRGLGIGCDDTAPSSSHTLDPAAPNGLNGWYISDVEVTLDASDPGLGCDAAGSGVKEIKYWVDSVASTIPGDFGIFTVTDDGEDILIEYQAIDNVGNTETKHSFTIDMDQTVPEVMLEYEITGGDSIQGWDLLFTATATDETSGMVRVEFLLNDVLQETVTGPGPTYTYEILGYKGGLIITIKAEAYDEAGLMDYDEVEPKAKTHSYGKSQSSSTTMTITLPRTR